MFTAENFIYRLC